MPLVGVLAACGMSGNVAARAGRHVLTAERLAQTIGEWRGPAGDTTMAVQVAGWWVEYVLFAQRIVAGDSLLDSATVREVLWPEARAFVLARWRERLFQSDLPLDSASLDSVYRAGDYRLIQHVLFQAPERGPPELRDRARRRAEALHARLARGLSWDAAQQESDDLTARRQRGSVGTIARGQTEPEFERAAFALEPGAISAVMASSFGYHIARRPPLDEVREEFRATAEPLVAERLDSLHIGELARRWRLTLRPGALIQAAAAVRDPLGYKDSRTLFADFERGRFTLGDLVRWLQAVPDWMHTQAERDPERQLPRFLDLMMGYELLYREALDNGVDLSAPEVAQLTHDLAGRVNQVQSALNVHPPTPSDTAGREELMRRAAAQIDRYLDHLPSNWQRFVRVPPLLADRLKRRASWAVYPRGIERALRRAAELRAVRDSAATAPR